MGFNSSFKGLKLLKTPGNGRLNNLNDPVLNALRNTGIINSTTRSHLVGSFYESQMFFPLIRHDLPFVTDDLQCAVTPQCLQLCCFALKSPNKI